MSAITAKASRKMKKYAVLTREPRCFLGSFDFSWEQRKFSDITFPAGEKNKDNLPLESYSITNEHGFVPQDEKFENGGTMREADKRMYYIVSPNSFAYNPARINVGSIGYQNIGKNVIVSSLYEVFKTSEDVDDRLLWHWFKSPDFQKLIMQLQEGGVRLYFYYDKLCMGEVSLPSLEEQRKIGKLFDTLDNLITLHQRKCALLFSPFQALISMMFTTSTFSWEQRKLGDIGKARSGVGFPDADQGGLTGVPFFKVSDMNSDGNENEMTVANNYVTTEQIADHRWSPITELPAIFFAKVGAAVMLNRKRLCRFPFLLDNNTMAYSLSPTKWDADFAKALFGTVDLTSLVQVGALPSYNAGDVESMEIYLPSLLEQEQIGAYFKHLDNLITLHQRKCISFTGRAGRLISTVNKKRITSSWEQRKFEEIAVRSSVICSDDTLPRVEYEDIVSGTGRLNKDIYSKQSSKSGIAFHQGDVLYGKLRPYLQNWLLPTFDGLAVGDFWVLQPQNADGSFLYRLIQSRQFDEVANQSTGTKMPRADWKLVSKTVFSIPSNISEQAAIGTYFTALDSLITLHQRKPFLMKWRTSDANRNQTNRLVL